MNKLNKTKERYEPPVITDIQPIAICIGDGDSQHLDEDDEPIL